MATCAYVPCSEDFTPTRKTQRFCLKAKGKESCKYKYHHAHRRNDPHACPWCSVWHDPEERAVLDALELFIREQAYPYDDSEGMLILAAEDLQGFIQHRRALLSYGALRPADVAPATFEAIMEPPALGAFSLTETTHLS